MKCKTVRLLEENMRDYFGINESLLDRIQKVPEILKIKMKTVVFIKKKNCDNEKASHSVGNGICNTNVRQMAHIYQEYITLIINKEKTHKPTEKK